MVRPSPRTPIKKPTQMRSQKTVDALLEAASVIIREEGLKGLTSNAIADKAGVNIASFYQYFRNKEAILQALAESIVQRDQRRMREAFQKALEFSEEQRLGFILEQAISQYQDEPLLRKSLLILVPALLGVESVEVRRAEYRAMLIQMIPDILGTTEQQRYLCTDTLVQAFIGMCNSFSLMDPYFYQNAEVTREIRNLCLRYLKCPLA